MAFATRLRWSWHGDCQVQTGRRCYVKKIYLKNKTAKRMPLTLCLCLNVLFLFGMRTVWKCAAEARSAAFTWRVPFFILISFFFVLFTRIKCVISTVIKSVSFNQIIAVENLNNFSFFLISTWRLGKLGLAYRTVAVKIFKKKTHPDIQKEIIIL